MRYKLGTNIPTVGVFGGGKTSNLGKHSEGVYLSAIKDRTNLLKIKDSRDSTGVNIQDVVTKKVPEQMINSFRLFQGAKVLESQVIMAVFSQVLRDDKILHDKIIGRDWLNNVLDEQKATILLEVGSKLSEILGIEYDLVNHYSESLRDYLGATNDGTLTADSANYHINFCMLLKLLKRDLITLDITDSGYLNGMKILYRVYESKRESFKNICQNTGTNKPMCVVRYFKDLANNEQTSVRPEEYKIRTLTCNSLNFISKEFALKKGYTNIYQLIYSYLK